LGAQTPISAIIELKGFFTAITNAPDRARGRRGGGLAAIRGAGLAALDAMATLTPPIPARNQQGVFNSKISIPSGDGGVSAPSSRPT
jgi:hypothetical protein